MFAFFELNERSRLSDHPRSAHRCSSATHARVVVDGVHTARQGRLDDYCDRVELMIIATGSLSWLLRQGRFDGYRDRVVLMIIATGSLYMTAATGSLSW